MNDDCTPPASDEGKGKRPPYWWHPVSQEDSEEFWMGDHHYGPAPVITPDEPTTE